MTPLDEIERRLDRLASGGSHGKETVAELLRLGEEVLEHWIAARGETPTQERREGFRLLALHRQLVRQGGSSLADALRVGATIQEISILDLREYRAETDDEDLQMVYENLLRASRNHLRVFAALLQERGEAYERAHLSQNLFDEIVSTPPEPGFDVEEPVE